MQLPSTDSLSKRSLSRLGYFGPKEIGHLSVTGLDAVNVLFGHLKCPTPCPILLDYEMGSPR